jgi:hypothetical protein
MLALLRASGRSGSASVDWIAPKIAVRMFFGASPKQTFGERANRLRSAITRPRRSVTLVSLVGRRQIVACAKRWERLSCGTKMTLNSFVAIPPRLAQGLD